MAKKLGLVVVVVLVLAGLGAWQAYAQGPGGNEPPCGEYYGPGMMHGGMMGGWNVGEDCPYADQMGYGHGRMHGHGMMGMMGGWNTENAPFAGGMMNGPMMGMWGWNTGAEEVEMTVSSDDAIAAAQVYLDENYPGLTVDEEYGVVYGYYLLHILDGEQLAGMLSINGTTGEVLLHHWHSGVAPGLDS